jgi:hypothetical protein
MTLPAMPPVSLRITELSDEQVKKFLLTGNVGLFASRKSAWKNTLLATHERVFSGVKVKLHIDDNDPTKNVKVAAIGIAIERCIKVAGLTFPDSAIDIYLHNLNQACLGYLLPMNPTNKFVIILGNGVLETKQQLVSTIIKDQTTSMGTAAATEACVTTAVIHELGHCFHQLLKPSQYYCVSQASMLRGKAESELTGEFSERHALLSSASKDAMDKFVKAANTFGARVSTYAGTHPNEFVAECFAGQVMGLTYDPDIMTAYSELGGPAVPGVVSTGRGRPRSKAFSVPEPISDVGEGL